MPEKAQHLREFVMSAQSTVDSQRRLAIPKAWRLDTDTEGTRFFLTLGSGPSLEFYEYAEFERRREIAIQKMVDVQSDILATSSARNSAIITLDKQGRFVVPQHLLDIAKIKTDVYCEGSFACGRIIALEIWNQIDPGPDATIEFNHSLHPAAVVTDAKLVLTQTQ